MNDIAKIAGYDYGTAQSARSTVSRDELKALEQTIGWTDAEAEALSMAAEVLAGQEEAMVDSWRAIIAQQPHLAKWFFGPNREPDEDYKAAVKKRFVQWVRDLVTRKRDQEWLDYQEEIGRRHTPAKKNRTDHAQTPDRVPLRYLLAFAWAVIDSTRPFLSRNGHSPADIERMHQAWAKSVLLSLTLWARPYVQDGLW